MTLALIKRIAPNMPRAFGEIFAKIPFSIRPGCGFSFRRANDEMNQFSHFTPEQEKDYIFKRVYNLVAFALENVEFYRQYYAENHFDLRELRSFEDIRKIPIVSKKILQNYPLRERSSGKLRRSVAYTGGSTGEPFVFYSDHQQIGHEWAYMFHIWRKLGFRQDDLLLSLALEPKKSPVFYDALRHSLVLNIHYPYETLVKAFLNVPETKRRVVFFRGYPSAWSEFLCFCETKFPEVLVEIKKNLRGSFLASEFPLPVFRQTIERATDRPTISWYGHSERAILAWEKSKPYLYETEQAYGYCETVTDSDGFTSLVGTAYWNYAEPFIRYRVDDGVRVIESKNGILRSFEISDGRIGDYLIDKSGKKFSITHLNLSCRESTWAVARSVQVEQPEPGRIILWIAPRVPASTSELKKAFDFNDLNLDIEYKTVERPIVTSRGKVMLKIRHKD